MKQVGVRIVARSSGSEATRSLTARAASVAGLALTLSFSRKPWGHPGNPGGLSRFLGTFQRQQNQCPPAPSVPEASIMSARLGAGDHVLDPR